jgi:hypothetical protein
METFAFAETLNWILFARDFCLDSDSEPTGEGMMVMDMGALWK